MSKFATIAAMTFLAVGIWACGHNRPPALGGEAPQPPANARLSAANSKAVMAQLARQWAETRDTLLRGLSEPDKQVQASAAYLLGLYRYQDAVGGLATHITLEVEPPIDLLKMPQWGDHPVVEALIKIGKPSVRKMLEILETSEDDDTRGLSARVIYDVEGPELSRIVVQMAIAEQKDPAKKKRLEAALPLVKGGEYTKPKSS